MILFEVKANGDVTSTPSRMPQGLAMSDLVVITEADYALVTMKLTPPSGIYIPDVVFTPTPTKGPTLWQGILPADAGEMSGVLAYQIFVTTAQGRVIPTQEGALTVQRGAISDMPESVEHLGTYSINSLYTLLAQIYAKAEDHDRGIDKNASDIDVLESARPVTGAITIANGSWGAVPDGFLASVALAGNPVQSGDIMLVLPDDANTRIASADMEVRVARDLQNGEEYDVLYFKSKTAPTEALYYRFIVVKKGATDTEMTANALIVGVNDVPEYIKDAIAENKKSITTTSTALTTITAVVNNPDHGLSAVERKIDNFLYGVTDTARDQLSEVLSLITANSAAIQHFVDMGGAPVGSGTLVVPAEKWNDASPTTATVNLPSNTMNAGSVMLLTPANDATKEAASNARLSVSVDASGDYGDEVNDVLLLLRAETAYKPEADMEFAFVILQTTAATSLVTLIGVDAAGSPAPTSVDLSAFDPDENGKGYITETYGEGEDAPKKVTEVIYDDAGNIIKIGNTAINWGEEG